MKDEYVKLIIGENKDMKQFIQNSMDDNHEANKAIIQS